MPFRRSVPLLPIAIFPLDRPACHAPSLWQSVSAVWQATLNDKDVCAVDKENTCPGEALRSQAESGAADAIAGMPRSTSFLMNLSSCHTLSRPPRCQRSVWRCQSTLTCAGVPN